MVDSKEEPKHPDGAEKAAKPEIPEYGTPGERVYGRIFVYVRDHTGRLVMDHDYMGDLLDD